MENSELFSYFFRESKLVDGKINLYYDCNLPLRMEQNYYAAKREFLSKHEIDLYSYKFINSMKEKGFEFVCKGYKTHVEVSYKDFNYIVSNNTFDIISSVFSLNFCGLIN